MPDIRDVAAFVGSLKRTSFTRQIAITRALTRDSAAHAVRIALILYGALAACSGERSGEAPAEQAVREAVQAEVQDPQQGATPPAATTGTTSPGAPRVADSCGRPVIDGDGVGSIRIGIAADSVKALCAVARDTMELRAEGARERILVVAFGSDTANVEVNAGKVWRIEIVDSGLRTADFLGVGTPLATLLMLKGGVQGLTGEGNLFVITEARCGLSFELSEPRSPSGNWPAERLRTLPKSTVVKRVLVIGCQGT